MLFVKLFKPELWVFTTITFTILGLICYFSMENIWSSVGDSLFRAREIVCRQDTEVPNELYAKIILFVMLMVSLVLNTAYSANLTSLLAVKNVYAPFHDLHSLFHDTYYEVGTVFGTNLHTEFLKVST